MIIREIPAASGQPEEVLAAIIRDLRGYIRRGLYADQWTLLERYFDMDSERIIDILADAMGGHIEKIAKCKNASIWEQTKSLLDNPPSD